MQINKVFIQVNKIYDHGHETYVTEKDCDDDDLVTVYSTCLHVFMYCFSVAVDTDLLLMETNGGQISCRCEKLNGK